MNTVNTQRAVYQAVYGGFDAAADFSPSIIALRPEVREMCRADRCAMFGKCWSCPPAAGELDVIESSIKGYSKGLLVQCVNILDDCFDYEGMMAGQKRFSSVFLKTLHVFREAYGDVFPMGAGACTLCSKCAYPQPCRRPEDMLRSLEACGVLVQQLCADAGLPYGRGSETVTYTGAYLFK